MNQYTLIAGVNGTGKSSLRGVLEGQGAILGHIIDADMIARDNQYNTIQAGKQAVAEINRCLELNLSFTQETTLSGKRVEQTLKRARRQGYYVVMYYIGLNTAQESIKRIQNRVAKGGHDIPSDDVSRRFQGRTEALQRVLPYCDEVIFYDNENGFVKVAEIKNGRFQYTNGYRPKWLEQIRQEIKL